MASGSSSDQAGSGQAPLVSVVVPNYNHADFLSQRIESILAQTITDIEIILLDDASTDDSRKILERYRDQPRVSHVLLNEKNSGSPLKQWEKGIANARGTWIWIAESDDYADPEFLRYMLESARKHPEAGMVYCDSLAVVGSEVLEKPFSARKNEFHHTSRWSNAYVNPGRDEAENYLLPFGTINNTSAVLFKAPLLKQLLPFELPLRLIGDKFVFVQMLSAGDIAYVPRALNYYRNPFSKAEGKLLHFVHEQFMVFDWVIRKLPSLNKSKVISAFYLNTGLSLVRGWNPEKVSIFLRMFRRNPSLFFRWIAWNLRRPFLASA